jgi:hypothetical protein
MSTILFVLFASVCNLSQSVGLLTGFSSGASSLGRFHNIMFLAGNGVKSVLFLTLLKQTLIHLDS